MQALNGEKLSYEQLDFEEALGHLNHPFKIKGNSQKQLVEPPKYQDFVMRLFLAIPKYIFIIS